MDPRMAHKFKRLMLTLRIWRRSSSVGVVTSTSASKRPDLLSAGSIASTLRTQKSDIKNTYKQYKIQKQRKWNWKLYDIELTEEFNCLKFWRRSGRLKKFITIKQQLLAHNKPFELSFDTEWMVITNYKIFTQFNLRNCYDQDTKKKITKLQQESYRKMR